MCVDVYETTCSQINLLPCTVFIGIPAIINNSSLNPNKENSIYLSDSPQGFAYIRLCPCCHRVFQSLLLYYPPEYGIVTLLLGIIGIGCIWLTPNIALHLQAKELKFSLIRPQNILPKLFVLSHGFQQIPGMISCWLVSKVTFFLLVSQRGIRCQVLMSRQFSQFFPWYSM